VGIATSDGNPVSGDSRERAMEAIGTYVGSWGLFLVPVIITKHWKPSDSDEETYSNKGKAAVKNAVAA
jgi:hypothetical protein